MTKSEQARADAMADAETLGARAHMVIFRCCCSYCEEYVYTLVVDAAHAAFRAVPGLKG